MTIRTRLSIWFSILAAVVLTLLAIVRYTGYKQLLQSEKDYHLKVVADILDSSIPRREPTEEDVQKAVSRMFREYPDIELKGTLIEVYDSSRSTIFVSSLSEAEKLPVTEDMWDKALQRKKTLTTLPAPEGDTSMRILTKPVFNLDKLVYLIQVGNSTHDIDNILENFLILNIILIPTTTLLIGGGGWLLTKRALSPLDAVIKASNRISSGDFKHRIEADDASAEIRDLTGAFNQMTARLEASFQQVRDFSENVSHELRIPLSILRGQTELSLKRVRSEEEYQKTLESNLEEVLRMEKIVERLLFLAKAERGEVEINCAEIDISSLLRRVFEQFQIPAREKNIRLVLNAAGPVLIKGDDILLRELLFNLVQNAITYTPENGDIELSLSRDEGYILISVADTGYGIPEEDIPYIFDRFFQVDKSRSSQGSGLGLSICRWIVESHKGKISVESIVGKGSRFTVSLPYSN